MIDEVFMKFSNLGRGKCVVLPVIVFMLSACGGEATDTRVPDSTADATPIEASPDPNPEPEEEAFIVPKPTDGADEIVGDRSDNIIRGAAGDDTLVGKEGDDQLDGGPGNDVLIGGRGNDVMLGRGGSDIFRGGAGDDVMTGAFNGDKYYFAGNFGNDTITDFDAENVQEKLNFAGVDAIENFDDFLVNHASQEGADVVIRDGNGNSVTLEGVMLSDIDESDLVF